MVTERRSFLRAIAALPFFVPFGGGAGRASTTPSFQLGWNHPWIAYGHDFGPAWGHDGISTSGWTHETFVGARGFTAARIIREPETGRGLLRISADLSSEDPSRSSGEAHLSVVDHWPFACPAAGTPTSLDLDEALVRYRIRLPPGSAGAPSAPNGLQMLLKTRRADGTWPAMYTRWENINPAWEGRDIVVTVRVSAADAAHIDPGFDSRAVSVVGLKLTLGAGAAPLRDFIFLDEFAIETNPVLTFDFEEPAFERDVRAVLERAQGLSLVRVFVFCDGRASPAFAPDGSVSGLDDRFFSDFDALVQIAERRNVRLMPVLLDYGWCARPTTVGGVQLGGRAAVITDVAKRQAFLDRALRPLLERYRDHDAIFAWDVMNEPEWVIRGIPGADTNRYELVRFSQARQFIALCAQYVHRFAPRHLVTVGSARRSWVRLWRGVGLDLYQFHWYDRFEPGDPFPWRPADDLGLDRPCIVGEVPTAGTRYSAGQFVRAAMEGGYAGLLFWSYRGRDGASDLCSFLGSGPYRAIGARPLTEPVDSGIVAG